MIGSELGRRYARAIAELGREGGNLDALTTEFSAIADLYAGSEELRDALDNPLVALEAKRNILRDLCAQMNTSTTTTHTVLLLGDRRRVRALPDIARALREARDAERGLVRAEIVSGRPLKADYADKLQRELERITGKKIVLEQRVDATLLAGVVARIGDTVYDGSLRARLDQAKIQMLPN
jgi:F-type H+-transporting ATPase subunit delta